MWWGQEHWGKRTGVADGRRPSSDFNYQATVFNQLVITCFFHEIKIPQGQRGRQLSCDNVQLWSDKNVTDIGFWSQVPKGTGHHLIVFSRLSGLLFSQEVTLIQPNSDQNCVQWHQQSHLQVCSDSSIFASVNPCAHQLAGWFPGDLLHKSLSDRPRILLRVQSGIQTSASSFWFK